MKKMASAFGHAALALGLAAVSSKPVRTPIIICCGIFSSIMPDFDVIAFKFGIPYQHMWGHRGITHSILFAILWALLCVVIYKKWKTNLSTQDYFNIFIFLFLCTASHGMLDAMTTGGMGIAFFAPFTNQRYFFPWRVIKVSPLSMEAFFSHRAIRILKSEAIWIGLPSLLLLIIGLLRNRFHDSNRNKTI